MLNVRNYLQFANWTLNYLQTLFNFDYKSTFYDSSMILINVSFVNKDKLYIEVYQLIDKKERNIDNTRWANFQRIFYILKQFIPILQRVLSEGPLRAV